jgi:hypothetical protein
MPNPRTARALAVALGVLAASAAHWGAPAVLVFLLGYAAPVGLWLLSGRADARRDRLATEDLPDVRGSSRKAE